MAKYLWKAKQQLYFTWVIRLSRIMSTVGPSQSATATSHTWFYNYMLRIFTCKNNQKLTCWELYPGRRFWKRMKQWKYNVKIFKDLTFFVLVHTHFVVFNSVSTSNNGQSLETIIRLSLTGTEIDVKLSCNLITINIYL